MNSGNWNTILVPYDSSQMANKALIRASEIAKTFNSRLIVLTVVDISFPYPELFAIDNPEKNYFETMRDLAMERIDQVMKKMDIEYEKVVVRGKPSQAIVEVADQVNADLIVIARKGESGFVRTLLGSVSQSVIVHAKCECLVIPPENEPRSY